jgi:hypothetical protein
MTLDNIYPIPIVLPCFDYHFTFYLSEKEYLIDQLIDLNMVSFGWQVGAFALDQISKTPKY